jgi:hypothetical protein
LLEEIKQALQDEWNKIIIEEIREHISEMPKRCAKVKRSGGKSIKIAK